VRIVALHDEVAAQRSARAGKLLMMRWRTHSPSVPSDAEPEASDEPHIGFCVISSGFPIGFRFLSVQQTAPFGSLFSLLFSTGLALSTLAMGQCG
jgi:hypothetical protein